MRIDWGKVLIQLAIIVALTILGVANVISSEFVQSALLIELGYVVGNGKNVVSKNEPGPLLAAKDPTP